MACSQSGMRKLTSKNTCFNWNEDLQKELDELKEAIKEHVSLSPLDPNKEIHVHIDAANKTGMGYLLCQPKTNPEEGKTI